MRRVVDRTIFCGTKSLAMLFPRNVVIDPAGEETFKAAIE